MRGRRRKSGWYGNQGKRRVEQPRELSQGPLVLPWELLSAQLLAGLAGKGVAEGYDVSILILVTATHLATQSRLDHPKSLGRY